MNPNSTAAAPLKAPLATKPPAPQQAPKETPNSPWRRHMERMLHKVVTVHYGQDKHFTGTLTAFDLSSKAVVVAGVDIGGNEILVTVGHFTTIELPVRR